jgi:hypothetical protein
VVASAEDVIAAKIVCQLGLAPAETVRKALLTLDAQKESNLDLTVDLLSRGALDKNGRAKVRRYTKLYLSVRRDAVYQGIVERSRLVTKERLDTALSEAEQRKYEPRLGEILVRYGELTLEQDTRLLDEVAATLSREDGRVVESYRAAKFDGVARAITKDRNATLDTGRFTIRKLFRSKESQRLAKLAEVVKRETDKVGPPLTDKPTDRIGPAPEKSGSDRGEFVRVGAYLLLRRLDPGGESELHLARHPKKTAPVALRLFPKDSRGRYERESMAGRVLNEHVLRVHESGEVGDRLFLSLEYVAGETLKALLARESPLEVGRALAIFRQVALALDAVHQAGIVHGNVMSDAVLLGPAKDGVPFVKLAGFHSARPSKGREAQNADDTSLSPTLVSAGTASVVGDLLALGTLLFEILTGQRPKTSGGRLPPKNLVQARAETAQANGTKVGGQIPAALEELVARVISPERADRAATAGQIVKALDEVVKPALCGQPEDAARVGQAFRRIFAGG